MKSAIVVGAGMAGLAAALELARAGLAVNVFEACDRPGGCAQELRSPDDRFRFDMGPTIITMTDVLRRALGDAAFGALSLRRLEPGYRVLWPDGAHFDMHSDISLWLSEIARYRNDGAGDALQYLAMMHEQSVESRSRILEERWTPLTVAKLVGRPGGLRPWVFGNLRRLAQRYFVHPRLVEAATFQTLYLGLTPQRSPAIYGLLMSGEVVGGVWYAPGGTAAIVSALVAECVRLGVAFHFGKPVTKISVEQKRARSVVVHGQTHHADAVIVAADREPALRKLLDVRGSRRLRYGHSALVFYIGFEGTLEFPHHTVSLPDDPWRSYEQLDRGLVPDDILLYVAHPAASDATATAGAITALVPVPNRKALRDIDADAMYGKIIARLEHHYGTLAERVVYRSHRGPRQFEEQLGLAYGAAFGPDHRLRQMGPLRPSIAYRGARNLAFAGSGTQPGSGVPMVLISGRLAAEQVLRSVT